MIVKLLIEHHFEFLSLKGGCRGSSESTHVKMSNCWKSHALAHIRTYEVRKLEAKGKNPTTKASYYSRGFVEDLVIRLSLTDVHVAVESGCSQA